MKISELRINTGNSGDLATVRENPYSAQGNCNDHPKHKQNQEYGEIQMSNTLNHGYSGKRLLNVAEAAVYLGLSARTLYNRCAPKSTNPFPVRAKRVGKALRFDLRDLDFYIDSLDSQSSAHGIS